MYDLYFNQLAIIQKRIKLELIHAKVELRYSKMLLKNKPFKLK